MSMSLIGRTGLGQACPVSGLILTAAHVAVGLSPDLRPRGYVFQQYDQQGFVSGHSPLWSRDLAQVNLDAGNIARQYVRAAGVEVGDRVTWTEFNITTSPLRIVTREGKVSEKAAGHLSFFPEPSPGASGGCLFAADGTVVGIVVWSIWDHGAAANITGDMWVQ